MIKEALSFDMIRTGMKKFDDVRRDQYPNDAEDVYRSFLVGQIYKSMKDVDDYSTIEQCALVADAELGKLDEGFRKGVWSELEYNLLSNVAINIANGIRKLRKEP